jgi:hypothetical protein
VICTRGKTRKDGARTALYHISLYLCCSDIIICVVRLFVLFYVVFVFKCVLPLSDNIIAVNTLNAKLKTICHLLALLGAHLILHVSRIKVNKYIIS